MAALRQTLPGLTALVQSGISGVITHSICLYVVCIVWISLSFLLCKGPYGYHSPSEIEFEGPDNELLKLSLVDVTHVPYSSNEGKQFTVKQFAFIIFLTLHTSSLRSMSEKGGNDGSLVKCQCEC